jgi:hypothetical protein
VKLDVFAHEGDFDAALGVADGIAPLRPTLEIGFWSLELEVIKNVIIEALLMKLEGQFVNDRKIIGFENAFGRDVAEKRDFLFGPFHEGNFAPKDDRIRLDAKAQKLVNRVLSRLGFAFFGAPKIRNQGVMDEHRVFVAEFKPGLPNRFKERQRLNIADGAADFANDHIGPRDLGGLKELIFDFVGDVRDDLNAGAEVIAPPLFLDDRGINLARSDGRFLGEMEVGPTLIVA